MAVDLKGDAAKAAQQFLDQAIQEAKEARTRYATYAQRRYYLAITLKGIALFGGLAVATLNINQVALGIAISAAVLLDQLFSNYRRMMTDTVAEAAVSRTIRKVENNYNDQVLDIIKANQRGETAVAYDQLVALARVSARTVRQEMDRIEEAVARANIEFLSSLNLDQPAKTELPHTLAVSAAPTVPAVEPPKEAAEKAVPPPPAVLAADPPKDPAEKTD